MATSRGMRPEAVALGLLLGFVGCSCPTTATGLIFQRTVEPLDLNLDRTPVFDRTGRSDVRRIEYNFVDVRWHTNAIGDIMNKAGLDTVYYADVETFSVLGIWTQCRVHVYGK